VTDPALRWSREAIGAIASGVGLRDALAVPAALALLVAAAAGVMRPRG